MNEEIRKVILALRTLVEFFAKLTPTELDDQLLAWIDYILGDVPQPALLAGMEPAAAEGTYGSIDWSAIPWKQALTLLAPILKARFPALAPLIDAIVAIINS